MEKNEKFKHFIVFAVVCCISWLFTGCKTTELNTDVGNIRESSAFILGELESKIDAFDRGVERAIERSQSITDEVERVDYLFREYERAALQLRKELVETRAKLEALSNIYDSCDSDSIVNDSSSSCNDNTKS